MNLPVNLPDRTQRTMCVSQGLVAKVGAFRSLGIRENIDMREKSGDLWIGGVRFWHGDNLAIVFGCVVPIRTTGWGKCDVSRSRRARHISPHGQLQRMSVVLIIERGIDKKRLPL